ncbi:MAG: CocE/NonD family hydrolase [Chitinophagaceae bacterium]|nr:CocE/NonD family hydrolase [Oligoflexus sp.]
MTRPRSYAFFLGILLSFPSAQQLFAQSSNEVTTVNTSSSIQSNSNQRSIFTTYDISNVKIRTFDNLQLNARLYAPKSLFFKGKRPTIIFVNSWTMPDFEYEVQARKFAADGYVVLSYATRGFGGSDGTVTVGGTNDIQDISTIIDWMEANTRVDVANIAMAGISYGGGISLLGLAHEPRIKTAASMSGWGNLQKSLYRNDTIQNTWLQILLHSGQLTGHLDPDLAVQVKQMQDRSDVQGTIDWAAARSAETFVDKINERKAPVFVENSFLDALFPPLQMRGFYEKLEGPKSMTVDEGIHASASVSGLAGLPNPVWSDLHAWMDHWLIDESRPIHTGITYRTHSTTESYKTFPALNSNTPRFTALNTLEKDSSGNSVIHFTGAIDSGATSGIPLLSDGLSGVIGTPVVKNIAAIDRRYAAVLRSEPTTRALTVRGAPRLHFRLMPHDTPVTLVGYLYDVDGLGSGTLVSYSVMSLHEAADAPLGIDFDLNMTAFTVAKGHRLVVAIDTIDSLYAPAATHPYQLSISATPGLTLDLPLVP